MRSTLRRNLRPGDYLAGDHQMFHIERVNGDRVLVEDCLTYVLIDLPISELSYLHRVVRESVRETAGSPVLR